jgi:hypothetical protein
VLKLSEYESESRKFQSRKSDYKINYFFSFRLANSQRQAYGDS